LLSRRSTVPATGRPISWSAAVDRFARSVHRFHDRVEVVPDRGLRAELQRSGQALSDALTMVRARRMTIGTAIGRGRSGGPTDQGQATRDLLRAGTLCAQATEAAVAAAGANRHRADDDLRRSLDTVRSLVAEITVLIGGSLPEDRAVLG
jgi:hypothetical protein